MTKVFVSSTCYDLIDLRGELKEHLLSLGLLPVMSDQADTFEHVGAATDSINTCLVNVDACPVFICILSQRYGPTLGAYGFDDFSATQLEYHRALERKPAPRILFCVRDVLLGAYESWRAHKEATPPSSGWVRKPEEAIALFKMIQKHESLEEARRKEQSNWRITFHDSVDLKRQLTKCLDAEIASARLRSLADQGALPELTIQPYADFKSADVRNVGMVAAHDVSFSFNGKQVQHLTSIPAGYVNTRLPIDLQGGSLLLVRWRLAKGTTIEDAYQLLPGGGARLHARRLCATDSFHLLGAEEPLPPFSGAV